MSEAEPDPVWLETLTLRLRSLYGGSGAPSLTEARADAGLSAALEHSLSRLRRVAGDRYRILATLAEGGMGHVLLAHDAAVGRTVAIKRAAEAARPADALRHRLRLLAEAATIGHLQHPGVVPIHDLGIDAGGEPFFAMQRIEGVSLAELLAGHRRDRGDASLLRIVEVLRRVAETMAYAHSRGVVHRDLKPANVMVGTYGEVYVMDWGLAHRSGEPELPASNGAEADDGPAHLTRSGTVLGTPSYMPPERASGGSDTTVHADVYGIGAVLYEALSGSPPYARERAEWTVAEILAAIRERPPRPVAELAPDAAPELVAICERAMHREPERRYADMRALGADLQAWSEHRIVQAHGGGIGTHVRKWIQRNRPLAATVAAAAVALVAATAWFVVHLSAARDDAKASAATADANLREILDLAVVERVADLRRRADGELWPLDPAREAATQAWLQQAGELRAAQQNLHARRERLDVAPGPGTGPGAEPDARAPAATTAERDAAAGPWRRRLLDAAIASLDAFFADLPRDALAVPLDSGVAAVSRRIAAARELAGRSNAGAEAERAWAEAIAYVRGAAVYGGLQLRPQVGLLPIGVDPASGLLELAHLQTGAPAARDARGALQLAPGDGVVLVLLPGGSAWMGAAAGDARHPDAWAEAINEGPVHEVQLAPFLVSKFELTQAQWRRTTGREPSVHTEVSDYVDERAPLHPVESIDWNEARAVLHKLGLVLPTEAQWEYAARAGTHTPWYAGPTVEALTQPPAGNLADTASARALGTQGWMPTPGLDDGFVMHAPVGLFPPNRFGLFDVIGNVAEWCEDEYVAYEVPPQPGTGARPLSAEPATALYRGGAFDQPAQEARSANRAGGPPERKHFGLGLRPARALAR